MNSEQYMETRLEEQIKWYSNKSQTNQKWFKRNKFLQIAISALIPLLVSYSSLTSIKIIVGVLGVILTIISSIMSIYKFQENWIEYRNTAESLKHEKFLFITKCRPYDDEDPFPLLVERVEGLISKENSQWSHYITSNKKEEK